MRNDGDDDYDDDDDDDVDDDGDRDGDAMTMMTMPILPGRDATGGQGRAGTPPCLCQRQGGVRPAGGERDDE